MAMSEATLETEFGAIVPVPLEADAADNFADAYAVYAADAMALTPILPAGVAAGKAAMVTALIGIGAPGAAAGGLKSALAAFWTGVAGLGPLSFAAAIAIAPPTFSGLSLQPVFDANTDGDATQAEAAATMAAAVHGAVGGGTVTTPGGPPVVTPIT